MNKAATELIEVDRIWATLPQDQWDKVKECTTKLAEVYIAYDEAIAQMALSVIGLMVQAGIEDEG